MYAVRKTFTPPVVVPPYEVALYNIAQKDVEVLVDICNKIGGDPKGPRGATERLQKALRDAGVDTSSHQEGKPHGKGTITYESDWY